MGFWGRFSRFKTSYKVFLKRYLRQEITTTFLFDLDGVIRIYLDDDTHLVEQKHGLQLGTIDKIAFSKDLLSRVTTGKLKRSEWVNIIGTRINNLPAALEWENRPAYVDNEVLDIIKTLKSEGFKICLITNGTDNLLNELQKLGIETVFDRIFNSSDLGIAKPSIGIYETVLKECNLKTSNIVYIDDNEDNVSAAHSLGIKSLWYNNINSLKDWLKEEFR